MSDLKHPSSVMAGAPRRRPLLIAGFGAIALALVVVVAALLLSGDGLEDPRTVALPEVETDPGTQSYMAGPGAPILELIRATDDPSAKEMSAGACRDFVESKLVPLGEPPLLADLATGIPDRVAGDLAVAHVTATIEYVDRCAAGSDADREELRYTRIVLTRRLRDLGIEL